jgi:uncharacterized membrane-anchored protein YitT (DUF2179 family)
MMRTLVATLYLSFALLYTSYFDRFISFDEVDLTLAAAFGGVISGVGLGLVFRSGATTGGSDTMATLIRDRVRYLTVANIMFVIDAVIITVGAMVFGVYTALYAIIAVFLSTKTIDIVLEGFAFAKCAYIISDKSGEISEKIMTVLNRGVTLLNGKGVYTGIDKSVLLCVVSKKEIFRLQDVCKTVDPSAFIIISDVREVMGEGFTK